MKIRLAWPRRGSGNPTAVVENLSDYAPPGTLRNIWPFDPRAGYRRRPAQRAGIVKTTAGRVGTSTSAPFQGGMLVERATSISDYELVNCRELTASTNLTSDSIYETATNLKYNAYIRGVNGDIQAMLNERGQEDGNICYETAQGLLSDPATVSGSVPGFLVCWSTDGEYVFVLSMWHNNTGTLAVPVQGINMWSISKFDRDGVLQTAFGAADGFSGFNYFVDTHAADSFPNDIVATDDYLFVAAGKYIFCIRQDNGRMVQQFELPEAEECMSVEWDAIDSRLVVGFAGRMGTVDVADGDASTDEAPDVSSGNQRRTGFYGRSGVSMLDVLPGLGSGGLATVLSQAQYGVKRTDTLSSDYEDHPTFRIYEKSVRQPQRGCIVNSIAQAADGSVVVARTSHGWGLLNAHLPTDDQPAVTVCKISGGGASAVMLWETDVGAIRAARSWGNTLVASFTVHNDIPSANDSVNTVADPHPTVDAICVDIYGDVYVAGRRAAAPNTNNIWKISGSTGVVIWSKSLSDATSHWVNQNCLRYNPAKNTIIATGLVEDAGTTSAHLWELQCSDGVQVDVEDLGVEVTAYGLDVNAVGEALVGVGRVYA